MYKALYILLFMEFLQCPSKVVIVSLVTDVKSETSEMKGIAQSYTDNFFALQIDTQMANL